MQMQGTYWLEKVLKMISMYVNALLCTLQHSHTRDATHRCQFSELTPVSCSHQARLRPSGHQLLRNSAKYEQCSGPGVA